MSFREQDDTEVLGELLGRHAEGAHDSFLRRHILLRLDRIAQLGHFDTLNDPERDLADKLRAGAFVDRSEVKSLADRAAAKRAWVRWAIFVRVRNRDSATLAAAFIDPLLTDAQRCLRDLCLACDCGKDELYAYVHREGRPPKDDPLAQLGVALHIAIGGFLASEAYSANGPLRRVGGPHYSWETVRKALRASDGWMRRHHPRPETETAQPAV